MKYIIIIYILLGLAILYFHLKEESLIYRNDAQEFNQYPHLLDE